MITCFGKVLHEETGVSFNIHLYTCFMFSEFDGDNVSISYCMPFIC